MKLLLKIAGIVLLLAVAVVVGGILYVNFAFPKVSPAADVAIERTEALVERGKYLANQVMVCVDCHSGRDWSYFSAPIIKGTEGKGGQRFAEELGDVYALNITPASLRDWSDGEIIRAITAGVRKNGEALTPIMPYTIYNAMSEEDVRAIVAYLRELPALDNPDIPAQKVKFPMNLIFKTLPHDANPVPRPQPADTIEYGKYLSQMAGCEFCHTPQEKGKPMPGMAFAGGLEFPVPSGGVVRTANITPDEKTGIGEWSKEMFFARFRAFSDSSGRHLKVPPNTFNTVMPWTLYSEMKEEDLGAIYQYLRTVAPVQNAVQTFSAEM